MHARVTHLATGKFLVVVGWSANRSLATSRLSVIAAAGHFALQHSRSLLAATSGVKCFRSFLIRSLRYLNGRTLFSISN